MSKKNRNPDDYMEKERQIRLEQANLEPLPIIEKIKEMESKDDLNCSNEKCRCKTNKDSNKSYRQD